MDGQRSCPPGSRAGSPPRFGSPLASARDPEHCDEPYWPGPTLYIAFDAWWANTKNGPIPRSPLPNPPQPPSPPPGGRISWRCPTAPFIDPAHLEREHDRSRKRVAPGLGGPRPTGRPARRRPAFRQSHQRGPRAQVPIAPVCSYMRPPARRSRSRATGRPAAPTPRALPRAVLESSPEPPLSGVALVQSNGQPWPIPAMYQLVRPADPIRSQDQRRPTTRPSARGSRCGSIRHRR